MGYFFVRRDLAHPALDCGRTDMRTTDNNTEIAALLDALSNVAYQFGPFFFAVLFTLVITRSARQWYAQPNLEPEQQAAFRNYFYACWIFGMLLVVASVAWWIRTQWEGHHAFAGKIVALRPNQQLSAVSDDQNFWSRIWAHQNSPMGNLSDYSFVVVGDRPFRKGEVLNLHYWEITESGAIGSMPAPTATLEIRIADPTRFPQKYALRQQGDRIEAIPFD
jgi:hypothetical protein